MVNGEVYTKSQIDKLGNAVIFLCEKMPEPLTKTHILKLVFIIEEISVKRFGIPFFNLNFYVWQLGPVAKDLFVELTDSESENKTLLSDYIKKEVNNNKVIIKPKKPFCDDEFTDLEIDLLGEIVNRFKFCTANELINFTHRENTPWYNTALKNGVLELLESKRMTTTDIKIDLSETIEDDDVKLALFNAQKEFLAESKSLK